MDSPNFMQIEEYFKFRVNYGKVVELLKETSPIIDYELCNGFGAYIENTVGISFLDKIEKNQDKMIDWIQKYGNNLEHGTFEERDIRFREFNEIAPDIRDGCNEMLELYDKYVSEVLLKEE